MTQILLSKRLNSLLLILMPLLVLSACGSGAPPAGAQADIVFGPGDFILEDTRAGLADLSSYKATLELSFEGFRDGRSELWSKTYVMFTTKEPAARQLSIEKTGDLPDLDAVFMAEWDGVAYESRGETGCNATVIDPENLLAETWEPAGFLTPLLGAEETSPETVNGVAAAHYTFDERAFGLSDIAQSTGDVWVASEGGYIVKYLLTTEGEADYFGEGAEGRLTWNYQLTDVNASLAIEIPADCPAGLVDAPLMPDATSTLNMPGVLAYHTASDLAEVAAFYQEQLPTLGWQLEGEPGPVITGTHDLPVTTAVLPFSQGAQQLSVFISLGEDGSEVFVLDTSSGTGDLQADTEEGAGGLVAFLLPDATNVENTAGILTFDTSLTPDEAAAYYEELLPTLGWAPMSAPGIGGAGSMLLYTQGTQVLSVLIATDEGVTTITVIIA